MHDFHSWAYKRAVRHPASCLLLSRPKGQKIDGVQHVSCKFKL